MLCKNKNPIMIGGKMIAKGGYGCVYKPPLLCKGSTKRGDGVSKLMLKQEAIKELKEQELVDQIDPEFKYHLKPPVMCELGEIDDENDKRLQECTLIPDHIHESEISKHYAILQMQDGGVSLKEYLSKNKVVIRDYSEVEQLNFFKNMINLLQGLVDFEKNRFVNLDIKTDNIVYNHKTQRFNFIDFGLSSKIDLNFYRAGTRLPNPDYIMRKFSFLMTSGYYVLPFYFFLFDNKINKMFFTKNKTETTNSFAKRIVPLLSSFYTKGSMIYIDTKYIKQDMPLESAYVSIYNDLSHYDNILTYINKNEYPDIYYKIIRSAPLFSMALVLIQTIAHITGDKFNLNKANTEHNELLKRIGNFARKIITSDFTQMPSAREYYDNFVSILKIREKELLGDDGSGAAAAAEGSSPIAPSEPLKSTAAAAVAAPLQAKRSSSFGGGRKKQKTKKYKRKLSTKFRNKKRKTKTKNKKK